MKGFIWNILLILGKKSSSKPTNLFKLEVNEELLHLGPELLIAQLVHEGEVDALQDYREVLVAPGSRPLTLPDTKVRQKKIKSSMASSTVKLDIEL